MAKIVTLKDHKTNEDAYPQTRSEAVYMSDSTTLEQFKSSVAAQFSNYPNVTVNGTVTNLPDNEDIRETEQHALQLADRNNLEGMGYVILRQNKTFAEQVTLANTIYEIRYDFDLDGDTVTIPAGCVLKFVGGKLSNGAIVGNDTKIDAESVKCFELTAVLSGSWVGAALSEWFGLVPDCVLDANEEFVSGTDNAQGFANLFLFNRVEFSAGTYYTTKGYTILPGSIIDGHGATIKARYQTLYTPLFTIQYDNVIFRNFTLIGWRQEGTDITEHAHGVSIRGHRVVVDSLSIRHFRGDGVYVATTDALMSNVEIKNLSVNYCHRQGVSITNANGVVVSNCEFSNIAGTAPQAGIDIEPNSGNICKNIYLDGIRCDGNADSALLMEGTLGTIDGITIRDFTCNGENITRLGISLRKVSNVTLDSFTISLADGEAGIIFQDSLIENVTIENGIISGGNTLRQGIFYAVKTSGAKNIALANIEIFGAKNYGLLGVSDSIVSGMSFENIYVHHCYHNIRFVSTGMKYVRIKNVRDSDTGYMTNGEQYDGWTFGWGRSFSTEVATRIDYDCTNSGTTSNRPSGLGSDYCGLPYFDQTLGHIIWWTGTAWVDATGQTV